MQVLGIVDLVWNGVKLPIDKAGSFKQGGIVNKAMTAGRQVFNSQSYMASEVSASIPFRNGDSLAPYAGSVIAELQFVCDSGQTYSIPDAFVSGQPEISGGGGGGSGGSGGSLKITWAGSAAVEIINT